MRETIPWPSAQPAGVKGKRKKARILDREGLGGISEEVQVLSQAAQLMFSNDWKMGKRYEVEVPIVQYGGAAVRLASQALTPKLTLFLREIVKAA
jgi:hypothetical protein